MYNIYSIWNLIFSLHPFLLLPSISENYTGINQFNTFSVDNQATCKKFIASLKLWIELLMITLPNFLYPGGESKLVSSILAVIFPASSIVVTPSTAASQPLMFPKVILAFSTWKSGISVKVPVKFHEALRKQNTGFFGLNWICTVYVCLISKIVIHVL